MGASLIELKNASHGPQSSLQGLNRQLLQLIGEPFQFTRVSYGDELTLHFGDLRPAKNPKLKGKPYGAYVLGVRGSSWFLKSGREAVMVAAEPDQAGQPLSKEELESGKFLVAGSRVLRAEAFPIGLTEGLGLRIRFSDGSALVIHPAAVGADDETDGTSDDQELPEIADWELSTPNGHLSAGPGQSWSFA